MGEGIQWSIFAINLHPIPCPSSTLQNPQSSSPDGVNPKVIQKTDVVPEQKGDVDKGQNLLDYFASALFENVQIQTAP